MNSDDLAKNLANIYNKQLSKSPSPISGSDGNFKAAERENFLTYPGLENSPDSDELLSQSSDICFAVQENAFFRFRTNTDAKMDRMIDMKRRQGNIKTVKCEDNFVKFNAEMQDDDELFVRKDLSKIALEPRRSKLTEQLETLPPIAVNKFQKFSCFDGSSHPANEIRTIQVFIMPFPKEHRDYPVRCCVQATTKIEEFIGFILFKCTQDQPEVAQQVNFTDVKDYGLFITDETGEPDLDFPALDINEQIQRFQFAHLALAKRIAPNFQNRTLSVVSDTTVVNPVVRQSSVETQKSLPSVRRTEEIAMNVHDAFVEAPIYRAYRVNLISKKHFRSEVQLGISGEKVEIDPLQQKNSNYFFKPIKAIHYSMDSVAWCEISSRKSSRFEFKIAHNPMFFDPLCFDRPSTSLHESTTPTSFTLKIHSFETDPTTAEEIVMKVNNILVLRTSSVRREYLNRHEKTKKSFIRKKKFPI